MTELMDTTAPAPAVPAEAIPTATTTAAPAQPASKPEAESAAALTAIEPQNVLTRKFTEQEWTALKDLRVCILTRYHEKQLRGCCTAKAS